VYAVAVLTESRNPPQTYWRVLKKRLLEEGDQTVAHMEAIEVQAIEEEGEARNTDAAE